MPAGQNTYPVCEAVMTAAESRRIDFGWSTVSVGALVDSLALKESLRDCDCLLVLALGGKVGSHITCRRD